MKNKPKLEMKLVKISDPVHYQLRVLAAKKRVQLGELTNYMLEVALKMKVYEDFAPAEKI